MIKTKLDDDECSPEFTFDWSIRIEGTLIEISLFIILYLHFT